ncbi:TPA: hypothetical protein MM166_000260 [Klebsiella pneumoniae]|jgi:hypothetical protein|uniref:hypothetical protein n=1 Tax=Enterobacteriaceae TaxID=543 RepID=UPI000C1DD042|nr:MULTISPECIES: hypothetical protein [Klebsiella]AYO66871.1 hypothetical protein DA795_07510 [Klebsiella pneumoniae]MBL4494099.1 hypothetical protein [Klebsiella pneumoniae]MCP6601835.1 hypothetical protein [Klebsiella pneumoniae]MCP6716618.1 hypothetical protein [Klebsiella pneumoniae]MCQ3881482.1 hypothetical protein [Klebsiella variicola]
MSGFNGDINTAISTGRDSFGEANDGTALSNANSIAKVIGEGENAKNSVVWKIITYTLYMYTAVISVMMINDIYRYGGLNCINIIKDTWATYSPILTLSLGYMFGKRDKKD